jgi:alpha-methylacyl-CoA racemase
MINSKLESGRDLLEEMITSADVLIDPFRPGVMERLGLGPTLFLGDGKTKGLNERLIYARIVGYVLPFFTLVSSYSQHAVQFSKVR